MEELKLLIGMVRDLPSMALWVLAGFWAYKVVCIGSIFGIIKLAIERSHNFLVTKKAREIEYKEIRPMIDGLCITGTTDSLLAQLHRLKGKGTQISSDYIHQSSIDWLRMAIDDKIEKDLKK